MLKILPGLLNFKLQMQKVKRVKNKTRTTNKTTQTELKIRGNISLPY